jgi:putative endonuclease
MNINKSKIGKEQEEIALNYLKKKGYKIVHKNYSCKLGEIDIIAEDKDVVVFVEVKYRKSDYFGLPREAVNYYKQQKIRRVATFYLKWNRKLTTPCRFDVIEILGTNIEHIQNCF